MTLITRLFPAFDAGLALREKELARELGLVARARGDGTRNHPPGEASQPTEIEATILARGQHAIDEVSQWLKRRFAERAKAVRELAPTPAERDTGARVAEADYALGKLREDSRDRLEALALAEAAARMELRKFQRDNDLTRSARYARWPLLVAGAALALLFAEGALNARAFAEVSDYGFVGGWQAALIYGALNLLLGFALTGLLGLRYGGHVSLVRRFAGLATALAGIAAIVAYNGYLGTVRALLTTDPDGAGMRQALARFVAEPLGFANVPDALQLCLIGLGFALLFTFKGYVTFDTYPGYRAVHLRHVQALAAFDAARLAFRNAAERIVHARIDELGKALTAAEARNSRAIDHINEAEIDATTAETSAVDSAAVAQKLIRRYRDENAAIRTAPAPAYFAALPQLERELRGVPKVDFNRYRTERAEDLAGLRVQVGAAQARLREMALQALETVRADADRANATGKARAAEEATEAQIIRFPVVAAE